jgi:hypothetical protein
MDYAQAARLLWGEAGDIAAAEFDRLNKELFAGAELPPLPIVINLTAYGRCIGATLRGDWLAAPRITLATEVFRGSKRLSGGRRMVADVMAHEMVHAVLMLRGESTAHNDDPWCNLIANLSPQLLGREVTARPVRPRRIPNPERERNPKAPKTIVVRRPEEGAMTQADLASWPHSVRPAGYYSGDETIWVPTY